MGASGSAWIKHKKQPSLRADAVLDGPHPRFVRPGQRYFPVAGNRSRARVPLRVVRAIESLCELKREDAKGGSVRLRTARLLELDDEGAGRYYRFLGYAPRATYPTCAVVIESGRPWARIICPEWHPRLEIRIASAMLPPELRARGEWLACRADLSADAPARVRPHAFMPPAPGFDRSLYSPVELSPERPEQRVPVAPEAGEGCGDVVVFLAGHELHAATTGGSGLYLTGHPPPVESGARIYLHASGRVHGWRALRARRPLPNGTRILFDEEWHPVTVDAAPPARPTSGIQKGEHGTQLWAWRSWSRRVEQVAQPRLPAHG